MRYTSLVHSKTDSNFQTLRSQEGKIIKNQSKKGEVFWAGSNIKSTRENPEFRAPTPLNREMLGGKYGAARQIRQTENTRPPGLFEPGSHCSHLSLCRLSFGLGNLCNTRGPWVYPSARASDRTLEAVTIRTGEAATAPGQRRIATGGKKCGASIFLRLRLENRGHKRGKQTHFLKFRFRG